MQRWKDDSYFESLDDDEDPEVMQGFVSDFSDYASAQNHYGYFYQ